MKATLNVGDKVRFKVGRGSRVGTVTQLVVTEARIKLDGKAKTITRKIDLLAKATALALIVLVLGACKTTPVTPDVMTPKDAAIQCAKDAGKTVLSNAPAILVKVAQSDWTGALADLLKSAGPGVLCEIDVLVELLKGHGDLAGAIGAVDGASLAKLDRGVVTARLEAFRAVHAHEAAPAPAK